METQHGTDTDTGFASFAQVCGVELLLSCSDFWQVAATALITNGISAWEIEPPARARAAPGAVCCAAPRRATSTLLERRCLPA